MIKNHISCIYKITNIINNKFYIGSTKCFYSRKGSHIYKLNKKIHVNKYLQNSWNKYSSKNFKFEIIKKCDIDSLVEKEQYYIDNLKPSYNLLKTAYSSLGYTHSNETKLKISKSKKGKKVLKFSEQHKNNMSKAFKNRKYSDKTRKNMSLAKKGKEYPNNHTNGKQILEIKSNGTEITWPSANNAAKFYGCSSTAVFNALSGKSKSCKNSKWIYK